MAVRTRALGGRQTWVQIPGLPQSYLYDLEFQLFFTCKVEIILEVIQWLVVHVNSNMSKRL